MILTPTHRAVLEDSPTALRRMSDPVERERAAALAVEAASALVSEYAAVRRDAVREIYDRLPPDQRTWKRAAEIIGRSVSVTFKVAQMPRRRTTTGSTNVEVRQPHSTAA